MISIIEWKSGKPETENEYEFVKGLVLCEIATGGTFIRESTYEPNVGWTYFDGEGHWLNIESDGVKVIAWAEMPNAEEPDPSSLEESAETIIESLLGKAYKEAVEGVEHSDSRYEILKLFSKIEWAKALVAPYDPSLRRQTIATYFVGKDLFSDAKPFSMEEVEAMVEKLKEGKNE